MINKSTDLALGLAIGFNTELKNLLLNSRTVSPLAASAMGRSLKTNTTLQALHLKSCSLGEGAVGLVKHVPHNKILQFACVSYVKKEDWGLTDASFFKIRNLECSVQTSDGCMAQLQEYPIPD